MTSPAQTNEERLEARLATARDTTPIWQTTLAPETTAGAVLMLGNALREGLFEIALAIRRLDRR